MGRTNRKLRAVAFYLAACIPFTMACQELYAVIWPTPPPAPEKWPDLDIVFQTETLRGDDPLGPLGFVDGDGSGVTYFDVWVHNQWLGKSPATLPMFTSDGSAVVFRMKPDPAHAAEIVVMRAGERPVICGVEIGNYRPSPTTEGTRVLIDTIDSAARLVLLDLASCWQDSEPVTETILDADMVERYPQGGALSPGSGLLAFAMWDDGQKADAVIVRDLGERKNKTVGYGIAPAWSPDGQWLAYTGEEGLYLVRSNGVDQRLVLPYRNPEGNGRPAYTGDWPSLPSWSPDGEWLAYHKCILAAGPKVHCGASIEDYAIFKVNVKTGEEIKILDGGLNPYWRWKSKSQ